MELRQDKMTREERMEALFNYRKPDRVPLHGGGIGFNLKNAGYTIASAYSDPEKTFNAKLWAAEQYGWALLLPPGFGAVRRGYEFGGEIQMPESEYQGALSIKSMAVKTEEDVWRLEMPDPKSAGLIPQAMTFAKMEESNGLPVWFCTASPLGMAEDICGMEQFSRWILKKPELCHRLLQMSLDHIFNVLYYWLDNFGAEKVCFSMGSPTESNQVLSPKHFQQFALPYHVELQSRLVATGIKRFWFHICGDQNLNLPYLAEIAWPHPAILSFGHEVDIEVAARYFPKDIIQGNIETGAIQTGTPQQIYELCRTAIEKGKKVPGGFILAPGCELPVMAPPANVFAMTRAINDFGWYDSNQGERAWSKQRIQDSTG